jgi:hypothetical protein
MYEWGVKKLTYSYFKRKCVNLFIKFLIACMQERAEIKKETFKILMSLAM